MGRGYRDWLYRRDAIAGWDVLWHVKELFPDPALAFFSVVFQSRRRFGRRRQAAPVVGTACEGGGPAPVSAGILSGRAGNGGHGGAVAGGGVPGMEGNKKLGPPPVPHNLGTYVTN